jgi:hypothetical protein
MRVRRVNEVFASHGEYWTTRPFIPTVREFQAWRYGYDDRMILQHFQPDYAGRKYPLFDRMIDTL